MMKRIPGARPIPSRWPLLAVLLALPAARAQPASVTPRLRLLGSVQDAGVPHAGCSCERCEAAATDPARRRFVASAALIVDGDSGAPGVYLLDASPDLRQQLRLLRDVRDAPPGRVVRSPVA